MGYAKMKKLISLFIFALLFANIAFAGFIPYGLNGAVKYKDEPVEGLKIKIETKPNSFISNYDKKVEVSTNEYGEFVYDLGNAPFDVFYSGMVIKVTVCSEINTECVQTKTIGSECPNDGGCEFYFSIASGTTVTIGGETKIIDNVVKKYVCSDGTETDDASQCPEDTTDYWNYIIGAVIALGGIGFVGLLRYWYKKDPKRAVKMAKTYISKRKK